MDDSTTTQYDPILLDQLRQGSPQAFESLYRKYYRMVAKLVSDFHAPQVDAQDVFQDLLFVMVKKIRDPQFTLTAKMSTLIFAIAKNIILKKTGKHIEFTADETTILQHSANLPDTDTDLVDEETLEARLLFVREKLDEMEPDCRQIILLSFYEKLPQTQIAEMMQYSDSFVKVKKFRCLEQLRKLVKNEALFKD